MQSCAAALQDVNSTYLALANDSADTVVVAHVAAPLAAADCGIDAVEGDAGEAADSAVDMEASQNETNLMVAAAALNEIVGFYFSSEKAQLQFAQSRQHDRSDIGARFVEGSYAYASQVACG